MRSLPITWTTRDCREQIDERHKRTYRGLAVRVPLAQKTDPSFDWLGYFPGRINERPVMFANFSALPETLMLLDITFEPGEAVLTFSWRKDRGKRLCRHSGELVIGALGWKHFYCDATGYYKQVTQSHFDKAGTPPNANYLRYAEELSCNTTTGFDAIAEYLAN